MGCVVVGKGAVSAAGVDPEEQWETYIDQRPCWKEAPDSRLAIYPVIRLPQHAAIEAFTNRRRTDRAGLLALHAASQAVSEAGWAGMDFAILVGCSRGPTGSWEGSYDAFLANDTIPARTSPTTTLGSIGFTLAEYFGTRTLADSLSVTCSSGFHALLHGVALLQSGMVDRVLVGGTEAALTAFTLAQLRALRIYADTPGTAAKHACRPLATPPPGMVLGEGAAFLALERAAPSAAGGVNLGIGFSQESGVSSTGITDQGLGLQRAMYRATREGSVVPDLLIAHAPGTPRGDAAEVAAVHALFSTAVPMTSLKWATGHTFGASGPLGLVGAIQMLERQQGIGLPYADISLPKRLHSVLVNATGFGGNAVSVLAAWNP